LTSKSIIIQTSFVFRLCTTYIPSSWPWARSRANRGDDVI